MEIVFVWINNFRNLKNAGFNLGSEYYYDLQVDYDKRECKITRTLNENFIPDFFNPFLNITAIVGENGCGKSSFIEAICGSSDSFHSFTLYRQDNDFYFHYILDEIESGAPKVKISLPGLPELFNEHKVVDKSPKKEWKFHSYNFTMNEIDEEFQTSTTIKYSSIVDFNSGLNNGGKGGSFIDITANHLLYVDNDEGCGESFSRESLSNHIYNNTKKVINFILAWKGNQIYNFQTPQKVLLGRTYVQKNYKNKDEFIYPNHTGNEEIKMMYDFLVDLRVHISTYITNQSIGTESFNMFIGALIDSMIEAIDLSYRDFDAVEVFFRCNLSELTGLNPQEAVELFLKNQNVFNKDFVIDFINAVHESIETSVKDKFHDVEWETTVSDKTLDLIEKQKNFRNAIQIGRDRIKLPDLISFDWRNMSSGEKAYLNLFSRFHYAKDLIRNSIEDKNRKGEIAKYPETIYILIDEGEIGFHLQWQKEYIQKLHSVLPEILKFEGHDVKLQLIFTTHSPISLSDMPNDRVIYLINGEVQTGKKKTFGANIAELFADSFFFKNGLIGDFAKYKIDKTIDWLRNKDDNTSAKYHENVIANIDERIIRDKLFEMYSDKMSHNPNIDIERKRIQKLKDDFKLKYGEDA